MSYTGACVDEAVKGKSITQTDKLVIRRRNEPARAFDRLEHQENFMMMTFRQGSAAAMIDRLDCLKKSHSSRGLNIFPFIIKTFERTPGDVWINGLLTELSGTSCDSRTLRLNVLFKFYEKWQTTRIQSILSAASSSSRIKSNFKPS